MTKAAWVNQMSGETLAQFRGPAGWTSSPGPLAIASNGPRGQPAVPGDWGLGPKALGVHQLSRVTRAHVRGPARFTSCYRPLGPVSEGPQCGPTVPGDRGQARNALGDDPFRGRLGTVSEGPWCQPAFQVTQAHAQGPTVSTIIPGDSGPC